MRLPSWKTIGLSASIAIAASNINSPSYENINPNIGSLHDYGKKGKDIPQAKLDFDATREQVKKATLLLEHGYPPDSPHSKQKGLCTGALIKPEFLSDPETVAILTAGHCFEPGSKLFNVHPYDEDQIDVDMPAHEFVSLSTPSSEVQTCAGRTGQKELYRIILPQDPEEDLAVILVKTHLLSPEAGLPISKRTTPQPGDSYKTFHFVFDPETTSDPQYFGWQWDKGKVQSSSGQLGFLNSETSDPELKVILGNSGGPVITLENEAEIGGVIIAIGDFIHQTTEKGTSFQAINASKVNKFISAGELAQ